MAPLFGQEPVARQVLGPRGEHNTISLLDEHNIKLTSNDLSLYLIITIIIVITLETKYKNNNNKKTEV